jgi:FMN-dependent NADH-azoreductase
MNVLQVNTSVRTDGSVSSKLADEVVARVLTTEPAAVLAVRDLSRHPHPALDETALQALFAEPAQRTAEQAARVALDDRLIAEVQAADVVVIAAPMYNFGVSAQLKNWFDAIARARVTFRYTERGAEGLLTGKKVFVVLTRGGRYRDTAADSQVPYLKTILAFLGMTDVQFVYAEGLAMGAEAEAEALGGARRDIEAALA